MEKERKIFFKRFILCVCVLSECALHPLTVHGGQKKASSLLGMALQLLVTMLVVGTKSDSLQEN